MSGGTPVLNSKVAGLWTALVIVFVLSPLVVIIAVSLTEAPFVSFPWEQGFSFRWYAEIPQQEEFIEGGWNSLKLGVLAALASVAMGSLASLAIVRYSFRGRGLVSLAGTSPLFIPMVLTGLALVVAMSAFGIGGGLMRLLVGHIVITLPFVLRVTTAALTGFNMDQEYAAQILGASKFRAFFSVTLPQIRSGIFASAVMAFIVSFDNVALSLFLAGPSYRVLPVDLYYYAVNNFDSVAAAVSVAMIGFSVVAIVLLERTFGLDRLFGAEQSS